LAGKVSREMFPQKREKKKKSGIKSSFNAKKIKEKIQNKTPTLN
jgi:hypothetical protein